MLRHQMQHRDPFKCFYHMFSFLVVSGKSKGVWPVTPTCWIIDGDQTFYRQGGTGREQGMQGSLFLPDSTVSFPINLLCCYFHNQ